MGCKICREWYHILSTTHQIHDVLRLVEQCRITPQNEKNLICLWTSNDNEAVTEAKIYIASKGSGSDYSFCGHCCEDEERIHKSQS